MWIPFILSLTLGRSFDYNAFKAGQDLFPNSELRSQTEWINRYAVDSECKLVETETAARDLLDVGASVGASFSCKAYGVGLSAAGAYLKDQRDRSKSVEYLCKVTYKTKTATLRNSARPKTGWRSNWNEKDIGSHYVQSVSYGGQMIASFMFKSERNHDIERVAGFLKAGLTFKGITGSVSGEFEKFSDKNNLKATLDVKYYSTTPIKQVPTDMASFRGVIDDFKNQVSKVNGGLGIPIELNLVPLSTLNRGYSSYVIDRVTDGRLKEFESMLNDLRVTDTELQSWGINLPVLTSTQENQLGALQQSVTQTLDTFLRVGSALDFNRGPSQLDSAINLYRSVGSSLPYSFSRKLRALRQRISPSQ